MPDADRVNRAYAEAPLVRKQTSGSTGVPFVLFIDERVASFRSWRFRRPHFDAGETSPLSLEFLFPERFRRDRQVRVVAGKAEAAVKEESAEETRPRSRTRPSPMR